MPRKFNIWAIEGDADYQAWFKTIYDASDLPLSKGGKLAAGRKNIGRTSIRAKPMEDGKLSLGVLLNTGDEFWKTFDGAFADLVDCEVKTGSAHSQSYQKTSLFFDGWIAEHGPVEMLEFCSSHVGGYSAAQLADGMWVFLNDC